MRCGPSKSTQMLHIPDFCYYIKPVKFFAYVYYPLFQEIKFTIKEKVIFNSLILYKIHIESSQLNMSAILLELTTLTIIS